MEIKLIDNVIYNELLEIQKNYPVLTFQNKGYEYINISLFNDEEKEKYNRVHEILKNHIVDFVKFNNFLFPEKSDKVKIRCQYKYNESFTGVGYLFLDELLNGFDDE